MKASYLFIFCNLLLLLEDWHWTSFFFFNIKALQTIGKYVFLLAQTEFVE